MLSGEALPRVLAVQSSILLLAELNSPVVVLENQEEKMLNSSGCSLTTRLEFRGVVDLHFPVPFVIFLNNSFNWKA